MDTPVASLAQPVGKKTKKNTWLTDNYIHQVCDDNNVSQTADSTAALSANDYTHFALQLIWDKTSHNFTGCPRKNNNVSVLPEPVYTL